MRRKVSLVSGWALLVWQGTAALMSVAGVADRILAEWPDASWYATVLAIALSPPHWLVWVALIAGVLLLIGTRWRALKQA